jgi:hypothetical protein
MFTTKSSSTGLKMYVGFKYEVMLSPILGAHDKPEGSVVAPEGILDLEDWVFRVFLFSFELVVFLFT